MLKFIQYKGKFPSHSNEIPQAIVLHIAKQLNISVDEFYNYKWNGSEAKQQRSKIRNLLGFQKWSRRYLNQLIEWLQERILPEYFKYEYIEDEVLAYLRNLKIEPPSKIILKRIIDSAVKNWEINLFKGISKKISSDSMKSMDLILSGTIPISKKQKKDNLKDKDILFRQLKADPGKICLQSILDENSKLECIRKVNLPTDLFNGIPYKLLKRYRDRIFTEPAREIRRHPSHIRYALFSMFLYLRGREITDDLVDLLIQLVHNIGAKAEKKIIKEIIENITRISNKDELLYKMSSASMEKPNGIVKNVIFPVVSEQTIQDIIKEYKYQGPGYSLKVNTKMRSSYRSYYRRMLPAILNALEFKSNNEEYQPIINAIKILRKYLNSRIQFYPDDEKIPIKGVVPNSWNDLVLEKNGKKECINRIAYEICVFMALREKLRCKEIWVKGADRYRNPDEDLPDDFKERKSYYYEELNLPIDVEEFIKKIQKAMDKALTAFNNGLPKNTDVDIIKKKKKDRIKLAKLKAQKEPQNLSRLKLDIKREWGIVNLLDVLKEVDLRINFTKQFESLAQREIIDWPTLQKRLLLVLYAMGSNAGVKRIVAGDHGEKYDDLKYVQRRFITKEHLRHAISHIVNAIFEVRLPYIWGKATTACASDSKKFSAWDQNLLTEWHARYGGRGVMIYWHVEKGASCIYSQLKRCSSSEVASMIEGVMRHCTEMDVKKQYVDSHGQSYVAFAFCHLLGFELLPRLKAIHSKKLYRPYSGQPEDYKNLQPILTRPINWELIRQQYDQMVKFATAIRLGTAETESILKRFTRENVKHPTYKAFLELGKAIRTIFLCKYLHSKELRKEINDGLNVIELWNGVNDFIFFGKGGEFASNKRRSQELTVLSLHLIQNCLVYINILMIQQILSDTENMKYMTDEDMRGLTPLIYNHINPYGSFNLDMTIRIPFEYYLEEEEAA